MPYNFKEIEAKWLKIWEETGLYKTKENLQKKFYCLEMLPYPSGDIHMGHFRNYTIGDVVSRYKMMQGFDLLHPLGWDAFGLPAEEAAIKHKLNPKDWTLNNISVSRATLKKIGISYDWDKEIITCQPDYYKWNQWIFIKFFEKGLAYRAKALVNWCPKDKTVLANEQVEAGKCWRCGTEVTKKELEQWFFRITAYAERLLADLDKLNGWPENVKTMQRNWIGKSEGVEINFTLEKTGEKLSVFTTRPDTIYGVTFMSMAPEHSLLKSMEMEPKYKKEVESYIGKSVLKSDIERTATIGEKDGVFTGRYAINPLSGEKVALWVADYVLATYGTGIVMGVPAHDQRDFLFAKKYNLPIKIVIQPQGQKLNEKEMSEAYEDEGTMVNSGEFGGLSSSEGIKKVIDFVEKKKLGQKKVNYKLRDWLISRQRYWGTPIPMIDCPKCGIVPVPEKDLPVILPEGDIDYIPKGRSPLEDVKEFIETNCPKCKRKAKRDPDTMDTFVDSSWYHIRYIDNKNSKEIFDKKKVACWMPIDLYIGGITHATGHLLYFRFFTKFLHDMGYLKVDEPVTKLFNHGMVLDAQGEVMSKSKGNVVSPIDVINKVGVDTARLAMLFAAPSDKEMLWTEDGLTGTERFLNRVYRIGESLDKSVVDLKNKFDITTLSDSEAVTYRKLNQTIKKVTEDIEALQFNTAIAAMMEFINVLDGLDRNSPVYTYSAVNLALILAPFAPFMAEKLSEKWGLSKGSVFKAQWPSYDPDALKEEEITYVVQVNGRLRATLEAPVGLQDEELTRLALGSDKVKTYLKDKEIVKTIVVPNKLVNIVVK
ncbi:MAG: hypothetical protein RBG1_1C00001G1165 [candidate division Zixibacteria bacterium RBG-1]|nr:MAG: hypothetical protein RBG1_1C00001G1165 [candidate division Zixibacteria bacterium RBG-1]OGC84080.1 MAG: leucine--tRNA ligase [candidate division Zixibacteria bacterium RBG_19FT_COMBO_42_43]